MQYACLSNLSRDFCGYTAKHKRRKWRQRPSKSKNCVGNLRNYQSLLSRIPTHIVAGKAAQQMQRSVAELRHPQNLASTTQSIRATSSPCSKKQRSSSLGVALPEPDFYDLFNLDRIISAVHEHQNHLAQEYCRSPIYPLSTILLHSPNVINLQTIKWTFSWQEIRTLFEL